jgi:ABC-type Fe3+/spermidine/putrescine transport system ATPase subunit
VQLHNFIDGRVTGEGRFETIAGQALQFAGSHAKDVATLCFRPEHAALVPAAAGANSIPVTIKAVTYLGPSTEYEVVADTGEKLLVTAASADAGPVGQAGARMHLTWRPDDSFVVA